MTARAFLAMAVLLAACGGGSGPASPDAGGDGISDVISDVPGDVPADVPPDPASDPSADVPGDDIPDLAADLPPEVAVDVPSDVPADLPSDMVADVPPDVPPPVGCNGAEALCGRAFNAVAYPTTHNAMSSADDGWVPPNQQHGIERQLEDGVRAMMLDLWYGDGDSTDPATVYLCHGVCALGSRPLVDALQAMRAFLDSHPRDVLTLMFESYVAAVDVAAAFDAAGLLPYLHAQAPDQPWPTLDEMGRSGRRMVVFTDHDAGTPAWFHDTYAYAFENPWSAKKPSDLSCAVDRGSPTNGLFTLNHFAADPFPTEEMAAVVNASPFFLDTVLKCQAERGHLPNFPTVDNYATGDLFAVVRVLNGLDPAPSSP